jgi:N-acetylglucosamine kinase-like BadF-type ATPase
MGIVVATVQAALRQAGLGGEDVALAALGLAGADWPEDYVRREAVLRASGIARRVLVKNDAIVGLRAGTRRPYGEVIAAGTGSNTGIVAPDGREYLYGYYAFYGGAGDISREALHAVLREEDGRGQRTTLTGVVLARLGYASAEALLRGMIGGELADGAVLSLCSLVFEAADRGDGVAAEIIVRHGLALAEYATAAIVRFGMQQAEFDVVLAGSVFKGTGPLLVDTITQAVHRLAPHASIVRAPFEPAVGGVLLAYDALGMPVSDAMVANLVRTAPGAELFSTADGGQLARPHRRRRL